MRSLANCLPSDADFNKSVVMRSNAANAADCEVDMRRVHFLLVLAMVVVGGCSSAGIKNTGPTSEQQTERSRGGKSRTIELRIIPTERQRHEKILDNTRSGTGTDGGTLFRNAG